MQADTGVNQTTGKAITHQKRAANKDNPDSRKWKAQHERDDKTHNKKSKEKSKDELCITRLAVADVLIG